MSFFDLVTEDDLVSLISLIVILYVVGSRMVPMFQRRWGWRASAVVYVSFAAYACERLAPSSAADLVYIAFRAGIAGGLTVGPAFVVTSMVFFCSEHLRTGRLKVKRKSKPTAPVTQSSNREVEKQRREMQQLVKANNKARCEELQLSCELHFNRFASQLGSVLSRDEFDRWIQSYLAGQNDPDVVAKRTDMIEAMINEQVSVATAASKKGKAQFENIQELAEHFAQQRQEIQNLPYEDDMKDSILTVLNGQEDVAIESFFRNGGQ